jgi:SAM-dependent methyltransferase
MRVSRHLPWQLNVAAKVLLSRIPVSYRIWKRVGFFNLGAMETPEYAYSVFRRHFEAAGFSARPRGFVCLELGPGDSLASALIASVFGASQTYLVDVGAFASSDLAPYRAMACYLKGLGHEPPFKDLAGIRTLNQLLSICQGNYLTQGLLSLRAIPSGSVDFIFSHATLQQVRRAEFLPVMEELRRIQRPGGAGSHSVSMRDLIGGAANDLRFSTHSWESSLLADSGFYTNRIRYSQMTGIFRAAGFEPEVVHVGRWDKLPISKAKLAAEFYDLSEDDLLTYEWDVILH